MFWQNFQSIALAVIQVLLLSASGYVLVKRRVLDEHGLDQVSALVIRFLLPLFTFARMTSSFSFDQYPRWWIYPLIGAVMAGAGLALGWVLTAVFRVPDDNREVASLLTFQNSGNIPLMFVTTLFAGPMRDRLYVFILLYIISFNVLIWSLGVALLIHKKGAAIRWDEILNPPFVATVATLLVMALGWHRYVPQVLARPVGILGDCAVPLAMLVVGGNLATIDLRDVHFRKMTLFLAAKLVVMPALALALVMALDLDFALGFLIVMQAAVPSAVTLSMIARYYDVPRPFIDQGLFLSHLFSVVTMPVFLTLFMMWRGMP